MRVITGKNGESIENIQQPENETSLEWHRQFADWSLG